MMWMKPLDYKKPWREDKLNYVVTSGLYKGGQKYLLGAETFSRILFYLAIIASIVYGIIQSNYILVGVSILIWGIRYFFQMSVINKTAKSLGDKEKYYFSLPIFDFLQPLQSWKYKFLCSIRRKSEFMRR